VNLKRHPLLGRPPRWTARDRTARRATSIERKRRGERARGASCLDATRRDASDGSTRREREVGGDEVKILRMGAILVAREASRDGDGANGRGSRA